MRKVLSKLWQDDAGFIVSAELLFLFTVTVLGLLVGWVHVRNAVVAELTDVANAILALDQSYAFVGIASTCAGDAQTAGSSLVDTSVALDIVTVAPTVLTSPTTGCVP